MTEERVRFGQPSPELLRVAAAINHNTNGQLVNISAILTDAANEIERLRDALEAVMDSLDNRMINLAPAVDTARDVLKSKEPKE